MTKDQAKKEWQTHVEETANAWRQEWGDRALDEEWTGPAFADIAGKVIDALALEDPWRAFHDDVKDYLTNGSAWTAKVLS